MTRAEALVAFSSAFPGYVIGYAEREGHCTLEASRWRAHREYERHSFTEATWAEALHAATRGPAFRGTP